MNCPACQQSLKEVAIGSLVVDACLAGCAGLWFDNFELQQLKRPQERTADYLLEIEPLQPLPDNPGRRLRCPRCSDVVLKKHYFSQERRVEVDSCPGCGGVWLDHGELAVIRRECSQAQDQRQAAEAYLQQMFLEDWARVRQRSSSPSPPAAGSAKRE